VVGSRFSAPIQTGPWTNPASYTMGTVSFRRIKLARHGIDHPPPSSAEVEQSRAIHLLPLWAFVASSRVTFTCLAFLHTSFTGVYMYEVIWCLILKLYNFEIKSTGYTSKCRTPVGDKRLFSSPKRPDQLLGPSCLIWVLGSFPGIKQLGREVNHSSAPSAKVKNEWSYTSCPRFCLHDVDREKLPLYLLPVTQVQLPA